MGICLETHRLPQGDRPETGRGLPALGVSCLEWMLRRSWGNQSEGMSKGTDCKDPAGPGERERMAFRQRAAPDPRTELTWDWRRLHEGLSSAHSVLRFQKD